MRVQLEIVLLFLVNYETFVATKFVLMNMNCYLQYRVAVLMKLTFAPRFGILELRNRVTKPSYAKWHSKMFIEVLLWSY